MKPAIAIDVVSDVVCPWCFIGQKKLDLAIAQCPEIDIRVSWRPYQLDPSIPPGGMDRRAYMVAKFGSPEKVDRIHARIEAVGRNVDIAFDFEAIKVAANTLGAHRLIRWAGGAGNDIQGALVRHLFSANFEHGCDIGDSAVLLEAARACGMDVALVEALLPTSADVEAVQQEIATATRMGITGVPCFVLDRRYALMGAQEPEALADAIRQIVENRADG